MPAKQHRAPATSPFSPEEVQIIKAAQLDFWFFLTRVFPASFVGKQFLYADGQTRPFSLGMLHRAWAEIAQRYSRWCIMAPRQHLKTTVLGRGYLFWRLFSEGADIDCLYMSYKRTLAEEHVSQLKRDILANPFCRLWYDNNPNAKSIVDFTVRFGEVREDGSEIRWRGTVEPEGILAATRGRHPRVVICDDILSDFSNPLESVELERVTQIFEHVVMSLPPPDGVLGVVGTPQSPHDLLHKLESNPLFFFGRFRAITDRERGTTVWPEMFDMRRLEVIRREIGDRAFDTEYQLYPRELVDTFLPAEKLKACFDESLINHVPIPNGKFPNEEGWPVVGGMDVGKEVHPTHITFFVVTPDEWLIQVYSQFVRNMDYQQQAELINSLIDYFDPIRFHFDSTRSELEDRGLSKRARGIKFKKNIKASMALALEKRVINTYNQLVLGHDTGPGILLIGGTDSQQYRSLLQVTRELKSTISPEGHGDAFWSIAMAVWSWDAGPKFTPLGDASSIVSKPPARSKVPLSCPHEFVEIEVPNPISQITNSPKEKIMRCRHCGQVRQSVR